MRSAPLPRALERTAAQATATLIGVALALAIVAAFWGG